jgi:hypothetical protein
MSCLLYVDGAELLDKQQKEYLGEKLLLLNCIEDIGYNWLNEEADLEVRI